MYSQKKYIWQQQNEADRHLQVDRDRSNYSGTSVGFHAGAFWRWLNTCGNFKDIFSHALLALWLYAGHLAHRFGFNNNGWIAKILDTDTDTDTGS